MKKLILLIFALFIATSLTAHDSRLIPFKARITGPNSNPVADGVYDLTFKVYEEEVGVFESAIWSETHSNVEIKKGQVDILLGRVTSLNFDFKSNRYIGITIGKGPEMYPRHQLIPAFHAVSAELAYHVNSAQTTDIADQVVSSDVATHAINATFAENAQRVVDATSSAISKNAIRLNNLPSSDYGKATRLSTLAATISQLEGEIHTPPPGVIIAIAGEKVPKGYVKCDGSFYPKEGEYAALYEVLQDRYGASSSDFRVPDLRGYFLRGWLHDGDTGLAPEEDSRTHSGLDASNQQTGLTGNHVGTKQGHSILPHNHTFTTDIESQPHTHSEKTYNRASGDTTYRNARGYKAGGFKRNTTDISQGHTHSGTTFDGSIGSETRPINITVMYVIRYKVSG